MSVMLPNGTIIEMATGYDMPVDIDAITNAMPAVVTADDHTFTDGDIIEVQSGWTSINNRAMRVISSSEGMFSLERIDTTDMKRNTPGSGIGTARKITGWTQIPQISSVELTGGELQTTTYQFLEDYDEKQLATVWSAMSLTLTIAYDPNTAAFDELEKASDARAIRTIRATLPGGAIFLFTTQVSFQPTPTMTINELMTNAVSLALQSRPVRYPA